MTDGKEYYCCTPEACSCCQLTTGGEHSPSCPNRERPPVRTTIFYPEYVKWKREELKNHPEWGIRELRIKEE